MEWISIKDRLPQCYEYVPVTNSDDSWGMAQWTGKKWKFWEEEVDGVSYCPYSGDAFELMNEEEITHWIDVWKDMPEKDKE